jgi:hypothetical protein
MYSRLAKIANREYVKGKKGKNQALVSLRSHQIALLHGFARGGNGILSNSIGQELLPLPALAKSITWRMAITSGSTISISR